MSKFSDLDLDRQEAMEPYFTQAWPTNEVRPSEALEEIQLQMQAVVSDLTFAEKELSQSLERWQYYSEAPTRETLERILSYVKMARRTLT